MIKVQLEVSCLEVRVMSRPQGLAFNRRYCDSSLNSLCGGWRGVGVRVWATSGILRVYSCLCAQEWHPMVLKVLLVAGIWTRVTTTEATCKASTLPPILSPWKLNILMSIMFEKLLTLFPRLFYLIQIKADFRKVSLHSQLTSVEIYLVKVTSSPLAFLTFQEFFIFLLFSSS